MWLLILALVSAEPSVSEHVHSISVSVQTDSGNGSGVLKTRSDGTSYVWTAGHVVAPLLKSKADAKIVQYLVKNRRTVGKIEIDAQLIRYSPYDKDDIALLKIRKNGYLTGNTCFCLETPDLGTRLLHMGSMRNIQGPGSMTTGIYSQYDRKLGSVFYDQTTVTAFPGSSGGGIFLPNGQCVGLLMRSGGETLNLIIPTRYLTAYAKKTHCEWAIDDKIPVPKEDKQPIE